MPLVAADGLGFPSCNGSAGLFSMTALTEELAVSDGWLEDYEYVADGAAGTVTLKSFRSLPKTSGTTYAKGRCLFVVNMPFLRCLNIDFIRTARQKTYGKWRRGSSDFFLNFLPFSADAIMIRIDGTDSSNSKR
ncbi:MAG: hypothetical protein IJU50_06960 [Lachnospiraceae bacterium]|nr:hypothetical protein [Lachnospiraceae bacterium]